MAIPMTKHHFLRSQQNPASPSCDRVRFLVEALRQWVGKKPSVLRGLRCWERWDEVRWESGLHPVSEPCGHEDGRFVLVHP